MRRSSRTVTTGGTAGGRIVSIVVALFAAIAFVLPFAASSSQQFPEVGQNEVRLNESRFTVLAHKSNETFARAIIAEAVRNDTFPGIKRPVEDVLIAIAPDEATFRSWIGSAAPEWSAAVAFPSLRRIVMRGARASGRAGNPMVTLRHELAHLALFEALGFHPPRWFDEGYASIAAGEWNREQLFETSVTMVWRTLPNVDSLDRGFRGGGAAASWHYALAHRAVAELELLGRERGLSNFLAYWSESRSFEAALRNAYAITGEQFDKHWKSQTRRRYGALALVTNISAYIGVLFVLFGPLMIMRRRRDRRRLEAMRIAESEQEAMERAMAMAMEATAMERNGEGEGTDSDAKLNSSFSRSDEQQTVVEADNRRAGGDKTAIPEGFS